MRIKDRKENFIPLKKINKNNVIIMWDYNPVLKINASGETIETPLATWQEKRFNKTPSEKEIRDTIINFYNKIIDEKILTGFTWNGMRVWLSSENQFNYKAAYDLALQTNGETLPIVFKLGDDENVIYYEFKTIEELSDFYKKSVIYIQNVLKEGWLKKDSINWDFYKK